MRSNRQHDWTNGITIAVMRERLTPKQAARVKYMVMLFDSMDPPSEDLKKLYEEDIGHRWFCFCLDAVARSPS